MGIGGPYCNGPLKIYQFFYCIMHLLSLEVVGTTRNLVFDWINRNKNKATYIVMKKYVYRTIPLLKFDWCKTIDAESGWVSDNYLAYCSLMKWMYHLITTLQTDKADKHCSKDNINMMIGGMLSMVSQVMKRDVTDDTPSQMNREIIFLIICKYCVKIYANKMHSLDQFI